MCFRAWEIWVVILVIYSAWICPFEFAFLPYKQNALFIFDNVVNVFFAADIVLTFFVAYLDGQSYVLVHAHKKIALRFDPQKQHYYYYFLFYYYYYYYFFFLGICLLGLFWMFVRLHHYSGSVSCSRTELGRLGSSF